MKILVIPDIHETKYWENNNFDAFDKIVFLGDYFDFHGKEPEGDKFENFLNICKLKIKNDKVDLLLGNHDLSYILNERTNTYQYYNSFKINELLKNNINLFQIAVEYDSYVFSHLGISNKFMEKNNLFSLKDINDKKTDKIMKLSSMDWSGCGYSVYNSPVWIRPNNLLQNAAFEKQVVGHTAFGDKCVMYSHNGNNVIFCDTIKHDKFFELDTKKEYKYNEI